jgi:hypothetical protein
LLVTQSHRPAFELQKSCWCHPYQLSRLPKISMLELRNKNMVNQDVTKFSNMYRLQSLGHLQRPTQIDGGGSF